MAESICLQCKPEIKLPKCPNCGKTMVHNGMLECECGEKLMFRRVRIFTDDEVKEFRFDIQWNRSRYGKRPENYRYE